MRSGTHRPLVTALFGVLVLSLTASVLLAPPEIAQAATPVGIDQSEDPAAIAQLSTAAAAANPTASTVSLAPGLSGFDNIGADSAVQLPSVMPAFRTYPCTASWTPESTAEERSRAPPPVRSRSSARAASHPLASPRSCST